VKMFGKAARMLCLMKSSPCRVWRVATALVFYRSRKTPSHRLRDSTAIWRSRILVTLNRSASLARVRPLRSLEQIPVNSSYPSAPDGIDYGNDIRIHDTPERIAH
jgi:hypothetical protein